MTGQAAAVQTIARIDAQLRDWMARWALGSSIGHARVLELARLQALLEQAEALIAIARDSGNRNPGIDGEFQSYAATLRELDAVIARQEITARMRRAQLDAARARLTATAAWATRVRQLG